MKKFETGGYYKSGAPIEEIEITRETESSVFIMIDDWGKPKEVRKAKRSEWKNIHESWEDAKQFLLEKQQARVDAARRQLEIENARLGNIKGIKKSEAA